MTIKRPIRIGIVGVGKIARDQHIPAIRENSAFELAALISRTPPTGDVPAFEHLEAAFSAGIELDAVALCTPPGARLEQCRSAIRRDCAILLEKPPATTVTEALELKSMADEAGTSIFAGWHSRFAPMFAQAQTWSRAHRLKRGRVVWHEDARKWHPSQEWLWRPGGFGVFDPGINALSILTALCSSSCTLSNTRFDVPENVEMPVSACFTLHAEDLVVDVDFNFRPGASEAWFIHLEADNGDTLDLTGGGTTMSINDRPPTFGESREYAGLYQRFATIVGERTSDFDTSPLELAEAAFASAIVTRVPAISI